MTLGAETVTAYTRFTDFATTITNVTPDMGGGRNGRDA